MLNSARGLAYHGGWLCADSSCYSLLSLLSCSRRGQPRPHRRTISRPASTCPMGSSRRALRTAGARRSSSAPSPMAPFGVVTSGQDQVLCSRPAPRAGPRSASPTRPVGIGCGLRVADPASPVPVMCGCTTPQAANCSGPSISPRPLRPGPGSSTTWRLRVTPCT